MCIILIGHRVVPSLPIVVAANRDEYLSRPAHPPRVLSEAPWIVAGQDALAGGTWLGLNRWGVVGLTNQPSRLTPGLTLRSRGQLVLEALAAQDAPSAVHRALQADGVRYSPYNLFAVDEVGVQVAYHRAEGTDLQSLEPGWHVLPNGRADDRTIPKVRRALELLEGLPTFQDPASLALELRRILADHEHDREAPDEPVWLPEQIRRQISAICVHAGNYGTRSYSILMGGADQGFRYWHGEGKPCTIAPEEISLPAPAGS